MEEVQERIKDWHHNKAKNERDPFFRFLCHWICFNAWLDYQSGERTDRQMLEWLKVQSLGSSDLIVSYEVMKNSTDGARNLQYLVASCPIRDSKGRPDINIASSDDRNNVIEAIYRIRCNLFHGEKQVSNVRDVELVGYANRIMTKWIDALIAYW